MVTTLDIKSKVISKINETNDTELLNEVYNLFDENTNEIICLADEHKNAIQKAITQIENGKYLTNADANKEIDEWLNK